MCIRDRAIFLETETDQQLQYLNKRHIHSGKEVETKGFPISLRYILTENKNTKKAKKKQVPTKPKSLETEYKHEQ